MDECKDSDFAFTNIEADPSLAKIKCTPGKLGYMAKSSLLAISGNNG